MCAKFKKILISVFLFIPSLCFSQVSDVEHVVLIGSDGFGAFALRDHKGSFPNIEKLMKEGSHTLAMRSVLPSLSAASWASALTGAGIESHGYTECCSTAPELTPSEVGPYGMFPGIFGLIRQQRPNAETHAVYSWSGIGYLIEKEAISKTVECTNSDANVLDTALLLLEKKPLLSFICFSEPDVVGHQDSAGWGGDSYLAECRKIDGYVGKIMQAIRDNGMAEKTVVIFMSDHGGINRVHGGKTMREMEVPYVVGGGGGQVEAGREISEVLMVYDNAATIAYILGLEQPQAWIGRPIKSIFKNVK